MTKKPVKKKNIKQLNQQTKKVVNAIDNSAKIIVKKTYNEINNDFNFTYDLVKGINKQINQTVLVSKINWWKRLFLKILAANPILQAMAIYLFVVMVFAGFLMIPGAQTVSFHNSTQNNYFFSLFTSLSTITVIGLMLHPIPETYSIGGQVIIFILMEFGGIIFTYIVSNVYISFRSNSSNRTLNSKLLVELEKGEDRINTNLAMLKWNIVTIGGLQTIFAIVLWVCIFYIPGYYPQNAIVFGQYYVGFTHIIIPQYHNVVSSLWSAVFDSASGLSNAGMTLFGFANLTVYRNGLGVVIQFILALEFFIGGFGFPLFYDVILKIRMRIRHEKYKLSMYSKLSLNIVIILTIITSVLTFIFAYIDQVPSSIIIATNYDNNHVLNSIYSPWGQNPVPNKNWAIFFSMLNTHSAAFITFNVANLNDYNKWLYIVNMFIGCTPSSSTGQIKLVMFISAIYYLIRKLPFFKKLKNLQRRFSNAMITNSLVLTIFGVCVCVLGTLAFYFYYAGITYHNSHYVDKKLLDAIFFSVSVYSLCGMNIGDYVIQNHWGNVIIFIIVLISQMALVFSIFIAYKYAQDKEDYKKRGSKYVIKHIKQIEIVNLKIKQIKIVKR